MSEFYEFKSTIKTSINFTQDNLLFIDSTESLEETGRSARINGLIERYREVFYQYQPSLRSTFSDEDLLRLADRWMLNGKNSPWIQGWVANNIEMTEDRGQDVDDFIESDTLIAKIKKLNAAQTSVLEDMVSMHLLNVGREELSEREYRIIKTKLKAKLNDDSCESSTYLTGQIKGITRRYHGENFGEKDVHDRLMVENSERGKGYQDGFNLINLPV